MLPIYSDEYLTFVNGTYHLNFIGIDFALADPMQLLISVNAAARGDSRIELFLATWKKAIKIAGASYFKVISDDVYSATNRNQLRPNLG